MIKFDKRLQLAIEQAHYWVKKAIPRARTITMEIRLKDALNALEDAEEILIEMFPKNILR
jgi:hypothetical protein